MAERSNPFDSIVDSLADDLTAARQRADEARTPPFGYVRATPSEVSAILDPRNSTPEQRRAILDDMKKQSKTPQEYRKKLMQVVKRMKP